MIFSIAIRMRSSSFIARLETLKIWKKKKNVRPNRTCISANLHWCWHNKPMYLRQRSYKWWSLNLGHIGIDEVNGNQEIGDGMIRFIKRLAPGTFASHSSWIPHYRDSKIKREGNHSVCEGSGTKREDWGRLSWCRQWWFWHPNDLHSY